MTAKNFSIGVIGAGSWGTTLANLLAEKGLAVTLWVYEQELFAILSRQRCNSFYLPDVALQPGLQYTQQIEDAVRGKNLVLWASPVSFFEGLFRQGVAFSAPSAIHLCASKGIETASLKTLSQIAADILPQDRHTAFCTLSGPSFAREVARKMPTAVVVASRDKQRAEEVQRILATPFFRTYTSDDILGVEIGGALKNVIALASGIVEGLGFGHNTRAALITRGLAEMMRLGNAFGANPLTFAGLSGIGDLVLTCTSTLSRNYSVGMEIGRGKKLQDILAGMHMVAEGVHTTRAAHALALRHAIDMPIVAEINRVLFENKPPLQALRDLMGRDLKKEVPM